MTEIVPTIGRIVWYTVSQEDAGRIEKQTNYSWYRPATEFIGGTYPAMIVSVAGDKPDSCVNLKVELDSPDCFWATSRKVGEGPGFYQWMPYQKGQAAKTEAAFAQASKQAMTEEIFRQIDQMEKDGVSVSEYAKQGEPVWR